MNRRRLPGRRTLVMLSALVAALVVASVAFAASTIQTVRATSAYETLPDHQFGSNAALAWTQKPSAGSPESANHVWAKLGNNAAFRVDTGSTGSAEAPHISGNVIVYEKALSGETHLVFKNLVTRNQIPRPAGIDITGTSQRHPSMVGSMSTGFLLFDRHTAATSNEEIVLYNFATHTSKVLANGVNAVFNPGQVNGPDASGNYYADWQVCEITCDIHAYKFTRSTWNTSTNKYTPDFLEQNETRSGPGMSADGVLTFISGTNTCGHASIESVPFGSTSAPTTVVALPSNHDSFSTNVSRNPTDGSDWIYFHMYTCGGDSNLYRTALTP